MNRREAPESGLRLKTKIAPRGTVPETRCGRVSSTKGGCARRDWLVEMLDLIPLTASHTGYFEAQGSQGRLATRNRFWDGSAMTPAGDFASIVRLEDVQKYFGAVHALRDINLSIGRNEIVGLNGDNGAGNRRRADQSHDRRA